MHVFTEREFCHYCLREGCTEHSESDLIQPSIDWNLVCPLCFQHIKETKDHILCWPCYDKLEDNFMKISREFMWNNKTNNFFEANKLIPLSSKNKSIVERSIELATTWNI